MNAPDQPTRRDFLKGRAAADSLQEIGERATQAMPEPTSLNASRADVVAASYLMQVTRRAMATDFQVFLNVAEYPAGPESAMAALDLVESLEDQLTVYREDSEVMGINRRAFGEAVRVESRLFGVLQLARQLYEQTGGAFDLTSGPLSKIWGFSRRQGHFPGQEEVQAALNRIGGRWVELDEGQSTVRFLKRGIELNLNAIGKGYTLDRCAEAMCERGVNDFMIHGGQSSVLALGSRKRLDTEHKSGWQVALKHPLRNGVRLGEIRLHDRAIGTSGSARQYFYHKGRRYGHVIDPRSGWPAEGVLSASVIAPTAALADALSTAFYVMGVEAVEEYCRKHAGVSAILVCPGTRSGALAIHEFGLEEDEWSAA